ncbi:MAG: hypothetical protein FD121_1044 [Gallionellaceae bacterium]|nr:MAG: hypothetical protein FD121_1044 [Gallionellaceae bacterium]
MAECRGERHRNAEAEGDAEVGLRDGEEAFGERVARGEEHSGEGQQPSQRIERQDEREGKQCQHDGQPQGLTFTHLAAGERAVLCALHMLVDVAVGIVVNRASGGAHQHRAEGEDDEDEPRGMSVACDPHCPQRGP